MRGAGSLRAMNHETPLRRGVRRLRNLVLRLYDYVPDEAIPLATWLQLERVLCGDAYVKRFLRDCREHLATLSPSGRIH
jgi:hypothetical protein